MTVKAYRLLADRFEHKAGTSVYDCVRSDYGSASDDTHFTGVEHQAVTLDPAGGYPFFTVASRDLEAQP